MRLWRRRPRAVLFHPDGSVTVTGYSAAEALRICRVLAVVGNLPAPTVEGVGRR